MKLTDDDFLQLLSNTLEIPMVLHAQILFDELFPYWEGAQECFDRNTDYVESQLQFTNSGEPIPLYLEIHHFGNTTASRTAAACERLRNRLAGLQFHNACIFEVVRILFVTKENSSS